MNVNSDLFPGLCADNEEPKKEVREGVVLLPGYCSTRELYSSVNCILKHAPFRHMFTPGGRQMSVAITNCGSVGWVSDKKGYRYSKVDPLSRLAWPEMPVQFFELAQKAAITAGYHDFEPDCCLVNCYTPEARLSAHQDRDELCFDHPIVSVSIGLSAVFKLYGTQRGGRALDIPLHDGDVLVLGGAARLAFHGVARILTPGADSHRAPVFMQDKRINLTFRRAL